MLKVDLFLITNSTKGHLAVPRKKTDQSSDLSAVDFPTVATHVRFQALAVGLSWYDVSFYAVPKTERPNFIQKK
jgi:hypothetical protein